jgi:hypothetical protein
VASWPKTSRAWAPSRPKTSRAWAPSRGARPRKRPRRRMYSTTGSRQTSRLTLPPRAYIEKTSVPSLPTSAKAQRSRGASSVQRTCRSVAVSAVTFGVGAEEHGVGVGAEEHGGVTKDRSALDGAVCGARWITSHHRQRPVGGQARSGLTSEQSIEARMGQSNWPKNWARPAANTVAPRATSLAS